MSIRRRRFRMQELRFGYKIWREQTNAGYFVRLRDEWVAESLVDDMFRFAQRMVSLSPKDQRRWGASRFSTDNAEDSAPPTRAAAAAPEPAWAL